jgi:hypothetical protein
MIIFMLGFMKKGYFTKETGSSGMGARRSRVGLAGFLFTTGFVPA